MDDAKVHWPTPAWPTRSLFAVHPPPTQMVLEPSAGSGGIASVLAEVGHTVTATEVRPECAEPLRRILPKSQGHRVIIADFLRLPPRVERLVASWDHFSIVANPPYKPAEIMLRHVRAALALRPDYCAQLLPIGFLASKNRARFWSDYPPTAIYILSERPRFTGGGGNQDIMWCVWERGVREQRIRHLSRGIL